MKYLIFASFFLLIGCDEAPSPFGSGKTFYERVTEEIQSQNIGKEIPMLPPQPHRFKENMT